MTSAETSESLGPGFPASPGPAFSFEKDDQLPEKNGLTMVYGRSNYIWLVVTGTMELKIFPFRKGNFGLPTDELILFRGVCIPPEKDDLMSGKPLW